LNEKSIEHEIDAGVIAYLYASALWMTVIEQPIPGGQIQQPSSQTFDGLCDGDLSGKKLINQHAGVVCSVFAGLLFVFHVPPLRPYCAYACHISYGTAYK
jgi:hypothetical protein